jgi:hypothetical protein
MSKFLGLFPLMDYNREPAENIRWDKIEERTNRGTIGSENSTFPEEMANPKCSVYGTIVRQDKKITELEVQLLNK